MMYEPDVYFIYPYTIFGHDRSRRYSHWEFSEIYAQHEPVVLEESFDYRAASHIVEGVAQNSGILTKSTDGALARFVYFHPKHFHVFPITEYNAPIPFRVRY